MGSHTEARVLRWPATPCCVVLLVLAALIMSPVKVYGQEIFSPEEFILKRVDEGHIDDLADHLNPDDEQRKEFNALHDAYQADLETIHSRAMRRMREVIAVFREVTQEARRRDDGTRPQELLDEDDIVDLHDELSDAWQRAQNESDQARRRPLEGIEELLRDDQKSQWPHARRVLRRTLAFAPIRNAPRRDFDRHVDLYEVWDTVQDHDDLAELRAPDDDEGGDASALRREIEQRLAQWAEHIDLIIIDRRPRYTKFEARMARDRAGMVGSNEARRQAWDRQAAAWRSVYAPTRDAAIEIENMLRDELGLLAAERWRMAYDEALAPDLFGPESPDVMFEWLTEQDWFDDDQRSKVEDVYVGYIAERRGLRDHALHAQLEWCDSAMQWPMWLEGRIPEHLGPIEQRRSELAGRIVDAMRDLTPVDRREAFDEHLDETRGRASRTLHHLRH